MTSDLNRSLTLEYTLGTNLPERIIHPGGHIRNYYTPAGRKTGKKVFDGYNNLLSQELYYGDLIIKDGRATRILHGDGVVNLSGEPPQFDYHIKDHLGNVRLVIKPDASNNPLVLQANDYYPFGMSYSTAPGVNKYLYNSKEEQEMPGKFLDYGWRFYDAQLGRWHGVDPLAEKYYPISPYAYVANNPLIFIDPDGREIDVSELYRKENGEYVHAAQVKAFEAFANTKGGRAELAKYAKEGQVIAGITFDKDGKYHANNIDMAFVGSTGITDPFREGEADAEISDGRLKITVGTNPREVGSGVETIAHEMIIHGRQYSKDFMDDGKLNNSHAYKELRDYANKTRRDTRYIHHYQELNVDRNLEKDGIPIIKEYYQKAGASITRKEIQQRIRFVP